MNVKHKPTKVGIFGRSSSGKTTFFNRFIIGYPAVKKFIFDHEGEFAERLGIEPVFDLSDEIIKSRDFIVFDPSELFEGDLQNGFDFFTEVVFEVCKNLEGVKLFACDELQKLIGVNKVSPEFATLIETGRRYEIDTTFVSQQPNLIHNRVTNQLTEIIAFSQLHERAINFLEGVGFNSDAIKNLNPLEYISRDLTSSTEITGKISFSDLTSSD